MDGLDDFQKVRGFIRGLDNEYKAKVKTQYPKTLEEAIKSAHIFDDMSDKKALALSHNKSPASSFPSFKNKRKNANFSKEEHSKKPKGAKGPLTSDELARARKENLCFNCLGQHARKDCPQLRSNDPVTNKVKEKGVHTVQLLPLEASTKYSAAVEVSHQTEVHECCLTAVLWQPTFGPHELF